MKFLIWLLVLAAAAVALSLAAHNSGYVLLVYAPYRAHLSLTLFALTLIGLFMLSFLSAQLLIRALGLPEKVRRFRAERAEEKKRNVLLAALTAFLEGRYSAAETSATEAMGLGETSEVLPIIAARAAHAHREIERRDAFLAVVNNDSAMKLSAQAQFALDEQQPQSALAVLQSLRDVGRQHHAGVLGLELKARQMLGEWDAVLSCVDELERRHAMDVMQLKQIRQQAWLEKLRACSDAPSQAIVLWDAMPSDFRHCVPIAIAAARAFGLQKLPHLAWQVLSHALEAHWDSELAGHLGDYPAIDNAGHQLQAETWLKTHPTDAGLLLSLGIMSLHQQQWQKAEDYLLESLKIRSSRAALRSMGQLAEKQGRTEEALQYYRRAMDAAAEEDGSKTWSG